MERGFEQLIVIAAVILAGVFDLLVRWVRSRRREDAPVDASSDAENPVLVEEEADFGLPVDVELPSDIELSGEELVERALSGEELVERRVPPPLPPPPVPVPVVSRRPAPPPPVPVVSRRPAPPPPIRPRRISRRLLTNPLDARRGIIMMTILGPCRGLERPDSAP